jgi:hypothetical protein
MKMISGSSGNKSSASGDWLLLLSLVLSAGCCCHAKRTASDANPAVVVSGTPVVYETILAQLTSRTRKIAGEVAAPLSAAMQGLPAVQGVSSRPIIAVVEQGNWFFYATSTATDQTTDQPVSFIGGYAIKRGGREIIEWSVW